MEDIASNGSLCNQVLAPEWACLSINRLSDDHSKVTVIDESAGGGSITAHRAAFGSIDHTSPFRRTIVQDPATKPVVGRQFLLHAVRLIPERRKYRWIPGAGTRSECFAHVF